jgi:drug/metabolite transporter (DMT)-like permease
VRALLLIAVSTFCWAIIEPLGALAGVSGYQVVWTRYGAHVLFMLAVFAPRHGTRLVWSPQPLRQVFRSLLMLGMPLCFLWSARHMAIGNVMAVFWIAPLLVIAMTRLSGGSSGGMPTCAAALAGFAGAVLIWSPHAGLLRPASVLAVGMAFCFALYVMVSRAMKEEFILCKLFHTALWVFACLTVALPFFWRTPSVRGLVAMGTIGLLGWLGLWALDRAIELAPPEQLAPMLYMQILWTALIGAVSGARMPAHRTLAGVLLIASGLCAVLLRSGGATGKRALEVGHG